MSDPAVDNRGPTAAMLRARVLETQRIRAELLERAIAEQWCNGCRRPWKEWGPVCGGMTSGDMSHYHSAEWWRRHIEMVP